MTDPVCKQSLHTADPWLVSISNTNCEHRATQGLQAAGFEVWQPTVWNEVRIGKNRRPACKKQFPAPGYLFTRGTHWPAMIGIDGVRSVICIGFKPIEVSADDITRWQRFLAPTGMPVVEDAFRIGSEVRVTAGPLAPFNAFVRGLCSGGAVEVELHLFGRMTRTTMAREMLERV